ncbi:MAG TPA: thioredoxin family protein, partial [Arenimonas sp.]|nr:thioredoxin family protein [Arenimonas sp.]
SPVVAIVTFLALGLGLALPFLLIGFVPALASRLPRPGAWMDGFKQLMAFPMYLTAAWLVSVLAAQRGSDAVLWVLAGAVVLALGLWAWERARYRERSPVKALALVAVLAALWPLWEVEALPAPTQAQAAEEGVVPYSAERLAELRKAGRVVFVNMTADWCVTCKANEKTVLGRDSFRAAMEASNAVYMKGDWTNVDPAITAFLEQHGAVGVPLYVVFPKDGGDGEVLPTVLTSGLVQDALQRAAQ